MAVSAYFKGLPRRAECEAQSHWSMAARSIQRVRLPGLVRAALYGDQLRMRYCGLVLLFFTKRDYQTSLIRNCIYATTPAATYKPLQWRPCRAALILSFAA